MPGRSYIKIKLAFIYHYDGELTKRFPDYKELLRIVGLSKFKTEKGWSRARDAIIDTGAFTSLLPQSIWESLQVIILGDYFVRGLIPKKECVL